MLPIPAPTPFRVSAYTIESREILHSVQQEECTARSSVLQQYSPECKPIRSNAREFAGHANVFGNSPATQEWPVPKTGGYEREITLEADRAQLYFDGRQSQQSTELGERGKL